MRTGVLSAIQKPPNDCTDWLSVFPADVIESLQLGVLANERYSAEDAVQRAATMLRVLKDHSYAVADTAPMCPLRWGTLATNGVATFERLLHLTLAAYKARAAATAATTNLTRARQLAGQAYRHLRTAGSWHHSDSVKPAEAQDKFYQTILILLDGLTVVALQKDVQRKVSLLQVLANQDIIKQVAKVARSELLPLLFTYWIDHRMDPRLGAQNVYDDECAQDKTAASNAACLLSAISPNSVTESQKRFIAVNIAAYGQEMCTVDSLLSALTPTAALRASASIVNQMPQLQETLPLPELPGI